MLEVHICDSVTLWAGSHRLEANPARGTLRSFFGLQPFEMASLFCTRTIEPCQKFGPTEGCTSLASASQLGAVLFSQGHWELLEIFLVIMTWGRRGVLVGV